MSATYGIIVEPTALPDVQDALRDLVKSEPTIHAWWNHLPGLFLVDAEGDAAAISRLVAPVLRPHSYVVMKVIPDEAQGWLPERAWQWLERRHA